MLRELLADPGVSREPAAAKLRMQETLELLETLTAWSDEMLRLDSETLAQVLKLGARASRSCSGRAPAEDAGAVTPAHLLGP